MMDEHKNLLRAVRFERPEYIPMDFHINSACWHHYRQDELAELMTSYYAEHCLDTTVLYPGIQELLNDLKRQQFPMAVLSNKPDRFVKFTVSKLTTGIDFEDAHGIDCTHRSS